MACRSPIIDNLADFYYNVTQMSLRELKEEVAKLPEQEQAELSAYLEYLLDKRDASFRKDLGRKIADSDPSHWVSLEELKKTVG